MSERWAPLFVLGKAHSACRRKRSNGSAKWEGLVARQCRGSAADGWREAWKRSILRNLFRSGILTVYCLKKCATKIHKKLKIVAACFVNLLSVLWCTISFPYNFKTRNMSTIQRKHRGNRRARHTNKQSRLLGSSSVMAMEAEAVELVESAGEEVVDLTCESSESVVVDLTHNDSVVIVDDNHRQERRVSSPSQLESFVLSSDDDLRENVIYVTSNTSRPLIAVEAGTVASRSSGTVTCPICMDGYTEIVQSGRLIMSTKCGHVFCSQCLRDALKNASSCPTCRKKLNHKQCHPIYI